MGKIIDMHMIETSYKYGKMVYEKQILFSKAIDHIVEESSMYSGSARMYVNNFLLMMQGREYHRTMKTSATEYYLGRINHDYGIDKLKLALESVMQHVAYYKKQRNGNLRSIEELISTFTKHVL